MENGHDDQLDCHGFYDGHNSIAFAPVSFFLLPDGLNEGSGLESRAVTAAVSV